MRFLHFVRNDSALPLQEHKEVSVKVLVSDKLAEEGIELLRESPDITVDVKLKLELQELLKHIGKYDALLVRSATKVTKEVIDAAKNLKVIGRAGVGVDNIDVEAASKRGILVMNTPGGNTISAAEHTMSMLLALSRCIPQANISLKSKQWEKKKFLGTEIFKKTMGIVGLGRIGGEVAKRAQSFGMEIIACDPYISKAHAREIGVKLVSFPELIKQADYITIHIPSTPETKHIINKETINQMKEGVRIINCARGGIIDEAALAEAVKSGKVGGAALDVFEKEPPFDSPVLGLENIIVTPHLGASTEEAQINVARDIAQQVLDFLKKGIVRNAVNMPELDPEKMKTLGPYINLCEKLGRLQAQISEGGFTQIGVQYSGEILRHEIEPLTIALLKGLLEPVLEREVNFINAPLIAEERGIKVTESKVSKVEDFANLIVVQALTEKGENIVAGTLLGKKEPRLVRIGEFDLDVIPEGYMLLCSNLDKPGVIGKIGTILGNRKINIAGMQVGRKTVGGKALTIINVDCDISEEVLKEIEGISEIVEVKMVNL
ncbi:MAG: phosphoglycerate dehydrogenase [Firmicutes bacterium]|nr:phosphoglycerate dehydrogenase [Bacillota bacterium]